MIHAPRLRSHLIVTVPITILLVILGFMASHLVLQAERGRMKEGPVSLIAQMLEFIPPEKRIDALTEIKNSDNTPKEMRIWMVQQDGTVIFPKGGDPLPAPWPMLPHPRQPEDSEAHLEPRPGRSHFSVVRMRGEPAQYIIGGFDRPPGPPPGLFATSFVALVISVVLASALSFFILFYSMRAKAKLADSVISELQAGNLKARFPVTKLDETGQAMLRFNLMADEIERLVERLKSTEASRMKLLQELAHDLRTPVASIKNLLETVSGRGDTLPEDIRREFLALSLKEVEYFARLVEDLLFLAQVSEPSYRSASQPIRVDDLLDPEIETIAAARKSNSKVELKKDSSLAEARITGDAHLLRRLFRNAIDNAASFASSRVDVSIEDASTPTQKRISISVRDDGPGMNAEALASFGSRKASRVLGGRDKNGRLSVGLGSVIMKTIVELHRGELKARNILTPSGDIAGCEVTITLPA